MEINKDTKGLKGNSRHLKIILMAISIYAFNIFDAVATYVGIQKGLISEGNRFMSNAANSPLMLFWIKGVFTLILLIIIIILYNTQSKHRKIIFKGLKLILVTYVCVYIIHLVWIIKALT